MDEDLSFVSAACAVISQPKVAPADSFVLHAPLELLARVLLLPFVRPSALPLARERIEWVVAKYAAAGEPVEQPSPVDVDSVDNGVSRFLAAVRAGELDDVDRLASWLGTHSSADQLQRALAEPIAASLAAAAHGSILLYLLPRVAADGTGTLLRGPARELARYPDWQLRWFDDPDALFETDSALADALLDVPTLGLPGSDFIFPIMHQAEESGIATKLLAGVTGTDATTARRDLSRVAALSMLQEPPDFAPYGWSHCLTMPQAVIALADQSRASRRAVAVAATHVVGFRAALGQRTLQPDFEPERGPTAELTEAIALGPQQAAAAVWFAPDRELPEVVLELATRAAMHHDAHLAKYTLACFDAAGADPDRRRLYLAAAASLSGWWASQPADDLSLEP